MAIGLTDKRTQGRSISKRRAGARAKGARKTQKAGAALVATGLGRRVALRAMGDKDILKKTKKKRASTRKRKKGWSNMPNVAGVQFPYTPQGEQAAQLYQRSLSPGPGLGFRPLRMEKGGSAEARIIAQGLYALMSDGTNEQVQAYINDNRSDLEEIAKIDDRMFDMLRNVLSQFPVQSDLQGAPMEGEPAGNLGRIEDSVAASPGYDPETGDYFPPEGPRFQNEMGLYPTEFPTEFLGNLGRMMGPSVSRPSDRDLEMVGNLGRMTGPSVSQPSDLAQGLSRRVGRDYGDDRISNRDLEMVGNLGRLRGYAHGGYTSRGTVAGELEPRGYLTARQAGETMRERAKGLRGRRNYGGGIGSLYNRYG
jgi:hypothetical protein